MSRLTQRTAEPAAAPTPAVDNAAEPAQSTPQTPADKLAEISRIYRGEPEPGAEGQTGADGEPSEGTAESSSVTLEELGQSLSLDVEALYKNVVIPIGDDKSMTLGEIKDVAKKDAEISVRELQLEEEHSKRTGELMRAQGELKELIAALPDKALSAEARNKAAQVYDAKVATERKLTAEAIPEWSDETVRVDELAAMVDHLAEYGFPTSYLPTVVDHRSIRYIRENMLREKRIRAALAKVEEVPPSATGSGTRATPTKPAAGHASRGGRTTNSQKAAQVSSILSRAIRR